MLDIKGYENLYAVTEDGQVWSYRTKKFMKPQINNSGYQMVLLQAHGKQKFCLVHRLVALTYIPNPDNLPQVNHKDECRTNNSVDNLEWCTNRYNSNYGSHRAKLSKPVYCVELDKRFDSITEAQQFIGKGSIYACLEGRCKTAGGYHWQLILAL